ncbi:MAG TPA: Maf family protein [Armatimonadota bacterium]|nr:Maf family protein [Armatimonadota bacterium]
MKLSRPLILASASPRRAELLQQIELPFTVSVGHVHEPPPCPGEDILQWAQKTALVKAQATALQQATSPVIILSADTVVVLPTDDNEGGLPLLHNQPAQVLGKPNDASDARNMLMALSGREHTVISAFAIVIHPEGTAITEAVETQVKFRELTETEIEEYVASGEPLDKAGAYGIQGKGAVLIDGICGDYYTVVGLPLARLWKTLEPWRK